MNTYCTDIANAAIVLLYLGSFQNIVDAVLSAETYTDSYNEKTRMAMLNINETLDILCVVDQRRRTSIDFNISKLEFRYENKSRIESAQTLVTRQILNSVDFTLTPFPIIIIVDCQRNDHPTVQQMVAARQVDSQLLVRE